MIERGNPFIALKQITLNEVDIDFRIPGLPHSVVKQADNYRVRHDQYLHNDGRDIKTQKIGSTSILLLRKD